MASGVAVLDIVPDSRHHDGLPLIRGPGLGKSVQLLPLNLQHWLQPQHRPDRRCGRRDPPALFQIIQRIQQMRGL